MNNFKYFDTLHYSVTNTHSNPIKINGEGLSIKDVIRVAWRNEKVTIAPDKKLREKLHKSWQYVNNLASKGSVIYGVTTNFGGMADNLLKNEKEHELLQENLLWGLKCSIGRKLANEHTRAAMLVRVNALLRGASGIRIQILERIVTFLNYGITPVVCEYGSIGASGDLVPLSYIAGAILGLSNSYKVEQDGHITDSITALESIGLQPISLCPKEGLALVNGTSFMTGIAANCVYNAELLLLFSLHVHAFFAQALQCSMDSFHPFVHNHKPHQGQAIVAQIMQDLLAKSKFVRLSSSENLSNGPIQDRYSLRCLPQYLGVIVDGLAFIKYQTEIEINSATDNPLIDAENKAIINSGNFLGEYIGVGMDQLRHYMGLIAKHIDVQIALLVTPEFNGCLPASLAGNACDNVRFGLKGLQICANSIMPILLHLSNPITHLFPTHAEQFNQNINSQGFASANMAWQSIEIMQQYLAIAFIFAIQAIELRTYHKYGKYDATDYLSPSLIPLYKTIYNIIDRQASSSQPFILQNNEQSLDEFVVAISQDLKSTNSKIVNSILHNIKLGV